MDFTDYKSFLLIKALHIIAFVSWMAALLYLPRLFVYHSLHQDKIEFRQVFSLMQQRLIKIIMTPALIITLFTGILLLHLEPSYLAFWWMKIKLLAVTFMVITHCYFVVLHRDFTNGKNSKSHVFFRKINELPTVLMITIILLIVLKP
jgi:putative membrane protein